VLKQGWLEKRGEVNTAWKSRYFVLTAADIDHAMPKCLRYYKDEETAKAGKSGGVIECGGSCIPSKGTADEPGHPHSFEVTMPTRKYVLAAKTGEDVDEWITLIASPGDELDEASDVRMSTREPAESITSMASFVPTGPLNEVHSGWMKKKGQGPALFGGKMQKRYFVLYDNKELHYFEGSTMENIQRKGRIRLKEATALQRLKPDGKDFTFVIKVPGRDWVLDPGSMALWQEWEAKLSPMIGEGD